MVDAELVRKAAEAIYQAMPDPDLRGEKPSPFDQLHKLAQDDFFQMAEAVLKVFYEHTRGQTRERKPPSCTDCSADMIPTRGGTWQCTNCGSASGSV